jgi:CBS domain-containing protein
MLFGRLGTLTARDVMTERLVVLSESDSLAHAAQVLRERRISGAPVVRSDGEPVGLLSLSDAVSGLAGRLRDLVERAGSPAGERDWPELQQLLAQSAQPVGTVGERMSRQLITVRESTALVDVARIMCHGHWHRVLVLDEDGRLSGIVSTMDVLAAVVQASDEEDAP